MKHRENFRLSEEAYAILMRFVTDYGLTKTTIIELALRLLAQHPPLPPPKKEEP